MEWARRFKRWLLAVQCIAEERKRTLAVEQELRAELSHCRTLIATLEQMVQVQTDIAIDVHMKSPSYCILIGRYQHTDYVRCFDIPHEMLPQLIKEMTFYSRRGGVKWIDAHPQIRATILEEFRKSGVPVETNEIL